MVRRLPPLNALRAFEAAARHLSFKRAAAELHVTPAAVGQQVKVLEQHLGATLFRRLNRQLLLTDAAQAGLPALREAFELLGASVSRIRAIEGRGVLTVSVEPSFAAKWLVRRLDRFNEAHPGVDVRLDASLRVVDLTREDVDVGVRYGNGRYPGLRVYKLLDEAVYPVCSPRLLGGRRPLREPADLRLHTLIHEDTESEDETWPDWEMWLRAAGVTGVDATRGPRFSQTSMAVEAAVGGHGVALAGHVIVADDLAAGRLVRPFGPAVTTPLDFAYYLVCLPAAERDPRVAAFRDWALSQARGGAAGSAAQPPE